MATPGADPRRDDDAGKRGDSDIQRSWVGSSSERFQAAAAVCFAFGSPSSGAFPRCPQLPIFQAVLNVAGLFCLVLCGRKQRGCAVPPSLSLGKTDFEK